MNEKRNKIIIFSVTAVLHFVIIFFFVIETRTSHQAPSEFAQVMKVTDFAEIVPPPPLQPEIPQVEEIAEQMIETDAPPVQQIVGAATLLTSFEDYLPMHLVSVRPQFDENAITQDLVYPPIALRSGIEGRVILELFVDRNGVVQRVTILREEPEGRGFGDAAVRAFMGRRGIPAYANGVPVSSRYRYPVVFRIR
jgi:protein TonB